MDIGTNVKLRAQGATLYGTLIEQDDLGFTVRDSNDGTRYNVSWDAIFDGTVSIEACNVERGREITRKAA